MKPSTYTNADLDIEIYFIYPKFLGKNNVSS